MLEVSSVNPVLAVKAWLISCSCESAGMPAIVCTSRSTLHRESTAFAGGLGRTPCIGVRSPVSSKSCTIRCTDDAETSRCSEICSCVSSSKSRL